MEFFLESKYRPAGDQVTAIEELYAGLGKKKNQTLMGVTGSGKTFTMANVIKKTNKSALILSHNKTLAAQLYAEFSQFFPKNNVGYFISYYDYYQPESYIQSSDTYIEKSAQRNEKIEQFRLQATAQLVGGDPTIIVASVSCIYGLGNPHTYAKLGLNLKKGFEITRKNLINSLIEMQYQRNDAALDKGNFRVRGETIEVFPPFADEAVRIVLEEDKVFSVETFDILRGKREKMNFYYLLPAKHFVVSKDETLEAAEKIEKELEEWAPKLNPLERARVEQRTKYDLEMIRELGYCSGIENYSRHFDKRKAGERPYCLLDYFPEDFLIFIDESHVTIPQLRAMYHGDYSRKKSLVENGFRIPCAYDNRPLKFEEFENFIRKNTIFVSATPSEYEIKNSERIIEQIVRPTGLLDPIISVRKTIGQLEDLKREIEIRAKKNERVLITTLTKKMSEDLANFMHEKGIKIRYLHSEIETLERTKIIRELRKGSFDALVGINLLREGLDIPEVSLVAILDADKTGFLRSETSLIQTIGRAARNSNGTVIMYADSESDAMKAAIKETNRRREKQEKYNKENGIVPKTITKPIIDEEMDEKEEEKLVSKSLTSKQRDEMIMIFEEEMKIAAENLDFEKAISLRDKIRKLRGNK
jgi:excinuclease ABC subunit B